MLAGARIVAIRWREDLKRRWAVIVYADPYSVDEWNAALGEILSHPISNPPLRLLIDRRYSEAPPGAFARQITTSIASERDRFAGGHVAIVTAGTAGLGAVRMAEIAIEEARLPCRVRGFREWTDAERWLEEPGA
jgi:hypothetical protein